MAIVGVAGGVVEGRKRGSQKVGGLWESDKHMARSAKGSIDIVPVIL